MKGEGSTGQGFQKPLIPKGTPKPVGLAMMTTTGKFIACSCGGWASHHARKKVREDRAQRHLDDHHDGRGVWL